MTDDIAHLWCRQCEGRVGIVRDGEKHYAVCHCTHEEGAIDRISLDALAFMHPNEWEYVENGGSDE